ncbi:MAG: sigma-70 family RNA polymerase sigma factor [Pseudomonadota bacterium]
MENPTEVLYRDATRQYGRDIARFVAGYERDSAARQELLQEVHLALWQSFAGFAHQCSLRTWVYRVAHNVGVNHIQRSMRQLELAGASLDDVEACIDESADMDLTERRLDLERIMALVHALAAVDREVMLLYLEDLDAATIADVTGLSTRNVATKIHRIKTLLASMLAKGRKSA